MKLRNNLLKQMKEDIHLNNGYKVININKNYLILLKQFKNEIFFILLKLLCKSFTQHNLFLDLSLIFLQYHQVLLQYILPLDQIIL